MTKDSIVDNIVWHPPTTVPTEGMIFPIGGMRIFIGMIRTSGNTSGDSLLLIFDSESEGYESPHDSFASGGIVHGGKNG